MEALSDDAMIWAWLAPYVGPTRAAYLRTLLEWLDWCIRAGHRLLEATPTLIEQFAAAERKRGLAKRSVNSKLTPILGFYRWAHANGHAPTDIGFYVRRPSNPRRSNLRWLSREQLVTYLDAAEQTDAITHALVCLYGLNGIRLAEGLAARVEHRALVDGHDTLLLPTRKAETKDRVALPARTSAALDAVTSRERGRYFLHRGHPLDGAEVYRRLDLVTELAGTGFRVRPHMLRATFITLALRAGVPVADVMYSAGHSSLSMVSYYDRAYREIAHSASIPLAGWLDTAPDKERSTP